MNFALFRYSVSQNLIKMCLEKFTIPFFQEDSIKPQYVLVNHKWPKILKDYGKV